MANYCEYSTDMLPCSSSGFRAHVEFARGKKYLGLSPKCQGVDCGSLFSGLGASSTTGVHAWLQRNRATAYVTFAFKPPLF